MHSFIPDDLQDRAPTYLHRLEQTAHLTTAAAFALTIILVTTAHASELNAVADMLFGTLGWMATGVIAITVMAVAFTYYDRHVESYPLLVLTGGAVLALVGLADLAVNLWVLSVAGIPESVWWEVFGPDIAVVLTIGVLATFRHKISPFVVEGVREHKKAMRAVGFALLVALSLVAMPFMGGISQDGSGGGVVSADHDWQYQSNSTDVSSEDTSPMDVHQDNDGNWWLLGTGGDSVYKYDSDFSYTGTSNDVSSEDTSPVGFTQADDGSWWIVGRQNNNVYKYHENWSYTGESYDVSSESEFMEGITQDDEGNFWVNRGGSAHKYTYDGSSFSYTGTSESLGDLDGSAVEIVHGANGNFWVSDGSNPEVHKYNSDWTYTGEMYNLSSEDGDIEGFGQESGGNWWAVGVNTNSVYEYGGHATNPVTGRVTDSDGDPVSNATVYATGYDATSPPTIDGTPFDEIADDPLPDYWTSQVNEPWADRGQINPSETEWSETRVLMHSREDWGISGFAGTALAADPEALDRPKTAVDPDDSVVFSCWDFSDNGLDNVDKHVPGASTTPCEITIERVDPIGDTESKDTISTTGLVEVWSVANLGTKVHHGADMDDSLGEGVYLVYPENNRESALAYVVAPGGNVRILEADIENFASSRSEAISQYNQEIKNEYDAGNLDLVSTTTNSTGHYTLDVPSQATEAELRVIKDGGTNAADAGNLTRTDLRDEIDTTVRSNFDAASGVSFEDADEETFQSVCERMDPIAEDVGVPFYGEATTEIPNRNADIEGQYVIPNDLDPRVQQCAAISIVNSLLNDVGDFLDAGLANDLNDLTRAELEALLSQAQALIENNEKLCQEYADQIGVSSCEDALDDPEDLSDSDLQERVGDGYDVIDDTSDHANGGGGGGGGGVSVPGGSDDVSVGDGDTSVGDETFSTEWNVGGVSDWGDAEIMIRLTWSNGSTTVLNQSSEYVSVDESVVGADTVQLSEYPIGDQDPAAVTARLDVVTTESTGSGGSGAVKNPTWNGDIPRLDSVKVSKWFPGAEDTFTVGVTPKDTNRFGDLQRVEVTEPDGSTTTYQPENGEVTAQTNGEGDHRVAVVFTAGDSNNTEFTEVVQVRASKTSRDRPPSIRGQSGAVGRYAVVGHGLDTGEVEVERGGSVITMTAVIPQDADTPNSVTADTTGLSTAADATTTVRVRRGDSRQTIRERIGIVLHAPEVGEDALVWRNDNAITRDGNQWGQVIVENGTTVDTFSDDRAEAEIRVNADPNVIDRMRHWINANIQVPSLPIGAITFDPNVALVVGALLAARRRDPPEPPTPDVPGKNRQPTPQEV